MANADPTRSILHAVQVLSPARPERPRSRLLVRFLLSVITSLLVVNLALGVLNSVDAPKNIAIVLCLGWMILLCGGAPIVIYLNGRDQEDYRKRIRAWESDSRRLAVERLGLDLSASRMPAGLAVNDLFALDYAACDWLLSRDALDSLSWARGDLADTRDQLRERLDDAMTNLLAEAGAGNDLGPAPFVIERARALFVEVGVEANTLAQTQSPNVRPATDQSLEDLRNGVDRLRNVRDARCRLIDSLVEMVDRS